MKNILASLLVCSLCFLGIWIFVIQPRFPSEPEPTNIASVITTSKSLTTFTLVDTNENKFTEASLRGHWTLIFFGYTLCPEICPRTLDILRNTWNTFDVNKQKIPARFVFVDISPDMVSKNQLQKFLHNYRTEFIGVTGTPAQIHMLSDQLGIYSQQGQNDIDHTAALMLINPHGSLRAIFTPPFSAEDLAHDLTILTL